MLKPPPLHTAILSGCSGKVRKFILFSMINTYLQAQFRRWKSGNGRDTSVQQKPGAKVLSRKRMRINGSAHFSPYRFSNVFSLRVIVDAGNNSSASPAGAPDYQVGDRVSHTKFGQGIVRSLTKLTNDYEVVIEFDGFGQRKLRSSFAKLTKL